MVLYNDLERGDTFRENVIYKCKICHTKTNKLIMGGWPGMGLRLYCPGDAYKEHEELETAIKQKIKIASQIREFEKTLTMRARKDVVAAQEMLNNLRMQRKLLKMKIRKLQTLFSGKADDLKGLNKAAKEQDFYPSGITSGGKKKLVS